MPRYAEADDSDLFRAVVAETSRKAGTEDYVVTTVFGPYSDRRQATAQITRVKKATQRANDYERRWAADRGVDQDTEYFITGRVQSTATYWKDV